MDAETVWVLVYKGLAQVFREEDAVRKAQKDIYLTSQGRVTALVQEAVLQ